MRQPHGDPPVADVVMNHRILVTKNHLSEAIEEPVSEASTGS